MLVYTNTHSSKKQPRKTQKERDAYNAWLKSVAPTNKPSKAFVPLRAARVEPLRPGANAYKTQPSLVTAQNDTAVRSIMDPMLLSRESQETRDAIIRKSKQIAPAYNKGATQYITEETNPAHLGRKL